MDSKKTRQQITLLRNICWSRCGGGGGAIEAFFILHKGNQRDKILNELTMNNYYQSVNQTGNRQSSVQRDRRNGVKLQFNIIIMHLLQWMFCNLMNINRKRMQHNRERLNYNYNTYLHVLHVITARWAGQKEHQCEF